MEYFLTILRPNMLYINLLFSYFCCKTYKDLIKLKKRLHLDLGASQTQVFFKILIPYLMPAIASSAVIAFLASFENYNTTVFSILSEQTLTTVIASKVTTWGLVRQ